MGLAETMPARVDTMSMKDLRKELDAIGVDYSQCIEKNELAKLLSSKRNKSTTMQGSATDKVALLNICAIPLAPWAAHPEHRHPGRPHWMECR